MIEDGKGDAPVGYILKRYPRLSETFILNEIRALERLGLRLHIFSLLNPEALPRQPAVAEVKAPVTYFPERRAARILALANAHAGIAAAAPRGYAVAAAAALWWAVRSRRPLSVLKQFLRSAYVAAGCRRIGIRRIHAHFAHGPATVARLVSIMLGIPFSFTTHAKDLYLTRQDSLRRRIAHADFVVTCTRFNLDYLSGFVGEADRGKIHIVYHGIDYSAFPYVGVHDASTTVGTNGPPVILSVGRLVAKKGFPDLITACRLLDERGVAFRCVIVGEGPLRSELEDMVARLRLDGVVTFTGALAHDRLLSLYAGARVFALAPHVTQDGDRDGIPNVLAEAMAVGVPVVATSVSGIPELIEDGRSGILVSPHDTAALSAALERLLHEPEAQSLVAAARAKVERDFNCWETAKRLRALFAPAGAGGLIGSAKP